MVLEVFIEPRCLSTPGAVVLAEEVAAAAGCLLRLCPLPRYRDRARELGILAFPAFVLNGRVVAYGLDRRRLIAELASVPGCDGEFFGGIRRLME
jgi:hypothetical protein